MYGLFHVNSIIQSVSKLLEDRDVFCTFPLSSTGLDTGGLALNICLPSEVNDNVPVPGDPTVLAQNNENACSVLAALSLLKPVISWSREKYPGTTERGNRKASNVDAEKG